MVEHKGRSMAELDIKKIEKRILLFIHLCKNSKSVRKFLGRNKNYFISNRFSYISLHASVTGDTQLSLKYWCKSFISSPLFCISKRSFSIVNNLLFK